jgi:uncharacterized protein YndB with AHSA1/START domain
MGNTVKLHRVLQAKPELVYKAFTNADAMAKWIPPNGFYCTVQKFDAKVGGSFRMTFTNLDSGASNSFGGEFLELLPGKKLVYTDQFDDPNLPGTLTITVLLTEVTCGTEINITQENIPDVIPLEMCYLGWQDSMRQLANLVGTPAP